MRAVERQTFRRLVVNPPRDHGTPVNFVMGGPDGPNMSHRGREPYCVSGLTGWLSIKTVRRGRGVWVTPEGRHHLEEGYSVVLNHGQSYGFELAADEPVETLCAFFRPGFVDAALRGLTRPAAALLDDPAPAATCALTVPERVAPLAGDCAGALERIYSQATSNEIDVLAWDGAFADLAEALVRTALHLAIGLAPETMRASHRAEVTRRLARSLDFIHDNLDQPLSLDTLAEVAALSPHHFHRLFRSATGHAPHAYVTRLRLKRAARLLSQTRRPVTDICLACGYSSLGAFSSLFRRAYGVSPTKWRSESQDRRSGEG